LFCTSLHFTFLLFGAAKPPNFHQNSSRILRKKNQFYLVANIMSGTAD
jgi:hypothetical protein